MKPIRERYKLIYYVTKIKKIVQQPQINQKIINFSITDIDIVNSI